MFSPPHFKKPMSTKDVDLKARVEPAIKKAFEARAAAKNIKPSELLRRLVMAELGLQEDLPGIIEEPSPKGIKIKQATVRLPSFLMDAVKDRATAKGMLPGRWIGALVQGNLSQTPVMTENEIIALRAMNRELAAIGRNVNQIARALNSAVHGIERGQVGLDGLEKLPVAITVSRKVISNLIRKSQQSWLVPDEE